MNRIEQKMACLQEQGQKALITYITAGLPDMEGTKELIKAQEEAGTDVIELGIPFSDPVADGPVIQEASYRSICQGTTLTKVFTLMEELRQDKVEMPIVFMMYYNSVLAYGMEAFAKRCNEAGVDGVIIPDLPFEEQEELQTALEKESDTILIQLISPVSKNRIPVILEKARGFVYCVSSMGVTGQSSEFHKNLSDYLAYVKKIAKVPVVLGFGICTPEDVVPMREVLDGAVVGSHFIQLMEESDYDLDKAKEYCRNFKEKF